MRVNPVGGLYVQATFQTPYGYLFKNLLGVLIVSFILLALIIWCFVYMLNTILKQKKLSEIKNDFINNMTHELKTPIATVNAAVEAMKNFRALDDRSKTQSYLDISQKELQRLSDLVEKVLHISIEENNDLVLEKERINIVTLINEIIDRQRIKANKEVHFEFKNELKDPFIYVDKLHFSNAITNLIDNAIKYSGEKVHISIKVRSKDDQCIFIFKDDGIGIPAHYQPLIFDKFFRVPTGNIHNIKGFGLGLSYVKKVIEKHGGDIEVESPTERASRAGQAGKGTIFIIKLYQAFS
jgi:signal transduction histidine kinase